MPKSFLPLLVLSLIACCIEVDISAPSFPDIAYYFQSSEGQIQLTIAYNFLGFCLAALFYGPLSECYGRRKIMLIGNFLLLIGALGCVYSPNISFLFISRFIQGIGASASAVLVFAMIADIYQENEKGVKLIGIMNASLTILMATAPILGSFINKWIGWRGSYIVVAVICLFSWISLFNLLPETKVKFSNFNLGKILSDYRKLILTPLFLSSSLVPSILYSAYMSFIACSPFLYMGTFGLTISTYALHQAVIIISFTMVSMFSSKILQKMGTKKCILLGKFFCASGAILLLTLSNLNFYSVYTLTFSMIIFCVGFAICYPIIFTISLEIFPEIKGTASSGIMVMRALLVSTFVGISGYLYNGTPFPLIYLILCAVVLSSTFTIHILKSY